MTSLRTVLHVYFTHVTHMKASLFIHMHSSFKHLFSNSIKSHRLETLFCEELATIKRIRVQSPYDKHFRFVFNPEKIYLFSVLGAINEEVYGKTCRLAKTKELTIPFFLYLFHPKTSPPQRIFASLYDWRTKLSNFIVMCFSLRFPSTNTTFQHQRYTTSSHRWAYFKQHGAFSLG